MGANANSLDCPLTSSLRDSNDLKSLSIFAVLSADSEKESAFV